MENEPYEWMNAERAKELLRRSLARVTKGTSRVGVALVVLFGFSRAIVYARYLTAPGTAGYENGMAGAMFGDVVELAVLAVAALLGPDIVFGMIGRNLLERGRMVRGRIESGISPIHEGFGGGGAGPVMVRNALGLLVTSVESWLPTRLVHFSFSVDGRPFRGKVAAFYPDERPCMTGETGEVFVLIDPEHPKRAPWLCRVGGTSKRPTAE